MSSARSRSTGGCSHVCRSLSNEYQFMYELLIWPNAQVKPKLQRVADNMASSFCHVVGVAMQFRLERIVSLHLHARLRRHQQRSEEHTSELQSLMRISYAVFCLKKKKPHKQTKEKATSSNVSRTIDIFRTDGDSTRQTVPHNTKP